MHIQATLSTGNLNNWDDMFANPPVPPLSGAQNHFSAGILSRPVAYPPRPQESFNRAEPKRPKGDTQVSSHEVTFMERNLSQGSATSFQSACDSCCSDGRICHEPTCIEAPDVVDTCGRCPKRPRLEHVDLARGSDVLADSHRNTSLLGLGNNFDTAYEPHCGEHSLNNGTSFLLDTLFPDCAETLRNAYHSGHDFTGVDTMSHVPIGPAQILEVGTQVPEFGVEHHVCQWSGEGGILCGKACLSAPELQAHIKECHLAALDKKTGYKCCWEGCKRAEKRAEVGGALGFTQRGKLERHMQSHTNCKFSLSSIATTNLTSLDKCCQCEICGVEFSAEQALTQHMNARHTGKKPFECKYCGKRFPQQSAKSVLFFNPCRPSTLTFLAIHERTHTGERPLSCHICHKSFPESSNMSKHMKTHGEIGEFACNFPGCNKSYVRKNALKNHQRNDHGRACSVASTTTISTQAFSSREATTEP
jgi:hypothetical protein